jgi:hypothetical protein
LTRQPDKKSFLWNDVMLTKMYTVALQSA